MSVLVRIRRISIFTVKHSTRPLGGRAVFKSLYAKDFTLPLGGRAVFKLLSAKALTLPLAGGSSISEGRARLGCPLLA